MKSIFKKCALWLMTTLCIVSLTSCNADYGQNDDKLEFNSQDNSNYWDGDESYDGNSSLDSNTEPNIDITVIGGESKEQEISNEIEQKKITNIESLIYSSVQKNLEADGFTVKTGVAGVAENSNYSSLGLYYYDDTNFKLFGTDSLRTCGFIEIKKDTDDFYSLADEKSMIYVIDASDDSNVNEVKELNDESKSIDNEITNICTYNYENINSYHFVYQNKYVQYYQQTGMRIVYSTFENKRANYDLSFGNLYDYDNNVYIYDESIFGTYSTHSGESLFSDEDYEKLKNELEIISDQQMSNGYKVDEYKIVYISPESIQTYLNSKEEDTFFGYSVDELTNEFGLGTALEDTSEGFKKAQVLTKEDTSYNWTSFLIKIGIGCGIILVGAILSPITGGASFGCALLTISKVAITYALTSAVGTMAIKAVEGMISGKSITDALKDIAYSGLDSFANGFMIGAAVGSVGLLTGVIKPSACFVAGTPVIISSLGATTAIEDIKVGDYVWSYNQILKHNSVQKVTNLFVKEVDELVDVKVNDDVITTTKNHPFYLPNYDVWIAADNLKNDDIVLTYDGTYASVEDIDIYRCDNTKVYNFTVENNHTYYVGEDGILVHNECDIISNKRNSGVRRAWEQEKNAIRNGTSKYNWSPTQSKEILNAKWGKGLSGFDGHHIVPVNEVVGTASEYLISDPDNIVFLSKAAHTYVHAVGDSFSSTAPRVIEMVPWIADKVISLGLAIA